MTEPPEEQQQMPLPLQSMLAQLDAIDAQMNALRMNIHAFAAGMMASARRNSTDRPASRHGSGTPVVFGQPASSSAEPDDLLSRLPDAAAAASTIL